jgi:ABC-type multidrug transport system fused ATPase/permease subunit
VIIIAIILFLVLVGAAFLGRWIRRYLPEDHLTADSKDAVKLAMGLVATMTALVLGLLVSSAKGTYDTARSEVIQMAAKVAFLDRVLTLYGSETVDARGELRAAVADAARRIWSTDPSGGGQLTPNHEAGDALYVTIQRLSPHDQTQGALKQQIANLMVDLGQLRSLLMAQSIPSISKAMLIILISWLVVIFFGFSLLAPPNATTTLALVASAFSVAGAIFLILELDHPFGGVIHIPSEPMINVLSQLVK